MALAFEVLVGIGRVGASRASGREAEPLPAALAWHDRNGWHLETRDARGRELSLARLDPLAMAELLERAPAAARERARRVADAAWLVACAFGLPGEVIAPRHPRAGADSSAIWSEIVRTRRFTVEGKAFGRKPAEAFFGELAGEARPARRRCEVLTGAESLFVPATYQKSAQACTYRVWRDLADARDGEPWVNLWPMDAPRGSARPGRPWIFEASPELFARDLTEPRGVAPDWREAALLALGGARLVTDGRLWEPFPGFRRQRSLRFEGWVSGLTP